MKGIGLTQKFPSPGWRHEYWHQKQFLQVQNLQPEQQMLNHLSYNHKN